MGTSYIFSDLEAISTVEIMVGHPSDWLVFLVEACKRICNTFENDSILFYEYLFTRINLWLPLSNLKLEDLKFPKVPPTQLHPSAWGFMKVFQF